MLGGEVSYMGKYSCIAYTDGIPTMLVVCDETVMTFHIENGVIAAVSWMAPEESMQLPIAEQRMTIDPSLLTDENLKRILIGPEIALVNDGFTFNTPANLSSQQLLMLFLFWSADSTPAAPCVRRTARIPARRHAGSGSPPRGNPRAGYP